VSLLPKLHCWVKEEDYLVCPDGAEGRLKRRALLLRLLSKARAVDTNREKEFWKKMAVTLLSKLYAFRQADCAINERYFNGEEVMFSDSVRDLAELTDYTEQLVAMFNEQVAAKTGDSLDIDAIRKSVVEEVARQISYLADMAKAGVLGEWARARRTWLSR
jgi:hypothetical protein